MPQVFLHDLFYIICRQKYFCRDSGVENHYTRDYTDYTTDDIIIWVVGHGQGGWGTNNIPHSGAPVFINKHHLILFS